MLAGTPLKNWRILVDAEFYCPHALADGNIAFRLWGEDTRVLLNGIICTVSVPLTLRLKES